nr:AAA family ATPase [Lysinibacillus timonensis]
MENQLLIKGIPTQLIYLSPNPKKYPLSIFKVEVKDSSTSIVEKELTVVCKAPLPAIEQQIPYSFYGNMSEHPTHGKQFLADYYVRDLPTTVEDTVSFLGSGIIKGVGAKKAQKIVDQLGNDCILEIIKEPTIINSVKSLSNIDCELAAESLLEHFALHQFSPFFQSIGISLKSGMKIFKKLGDHTIESIKANPYLLMNLSSGIGFKRAEKIAANLGITETHPVRIKGIIQYMLINNMKQNGNTYSGEDYLYRNLNKYFNKENGYSILLSHFRKVLNEMIEEKSHNEFGQIIKIGHRISLSSMMKQEISFSNWLVKKAQSGFERDQIVTDSISKFISLIEEEKRIIYSPSQKDALIASVFENLLIITGGAGSGKTTVVEGIIDLYVKIYGITTEEAFDTQIKLLAPTGKAAKRLEEVTGRATSTIHRYIYGATSEITDIPRLFIIDETSMMDIEIAYKLSMNIDKKDKVIFVGDPEQLPSIGPGKVLIDMIESNSLPVSHLKTVFRQSDSSSIHLIANSIRENQLEQVEQLIYTKHKDMSFLNLNQKNIPSNLIKTLQLAQEKGHDLHEIQVLCPYNKGEIGVINLNQFIQKALLNNQLTHQNKDEYYETSFSNEKYSFCVGDKVIQTENNIDKGVFNGDVGVVSDVFEEMEEEESGLFIQFDDDTPVFYSKEELNQLDLAYCLTVHKSQGSEYQTVIFILPYFQILINSKLIYTAITRAKERLIFLGNIHDMKRGLNVKPRYRCTLLKNFIRAGYPVNPIFPGYDLDQFKKLLEDHPINQQLEFTF